MKTTPLSLFQMPNLIQGPRLTVATIVMKDRANVLLVKPTNGPDAGLWAIPDGLVNDGESVRNTAIRSVKEILGIDIEPRMTLFICERVQPEDHRVGIFVLAEPTSGEITNPAFNARWADVRKLGDIQKTEGMSDFTADAFVKFSDFLRSKAPTSGTVN
jgi:ADP-ribose pyrophosphatase YjhB (NUDIX family)